MKKDKYPERLTDGYYHVRTSWEDEESQAGQYKLLKSAVAKCDTTPGTHVFTEDGTAIYPEETPETESADDAMELLDDKKEHTMERTEEHTDKDTEGATPAEGDVHASNGRKPSPVLYGRVTTLLNVRAGTSLDEKKVGLLKKGRLIEILEVCGDGWYRISFDVPCGYAYVYNSTGDYIKTGSSLYTVVPADTIKKIAEKTLRDENRFSEIIELNGLTSNTLRTGMALLIP